MSIANNNSVLGFLDLSLYINEHNKICIDVYDKPTNSFKYVLPSHFTYVWLASRKRVLTKFLKELQTISDSDEKFDIRSFEIWIPKLSDRGRSQSYSSKTKNSFPLLEAITCIFYMVILERKLYFQKVASISHKR